MKLFASKEQQKNNEKRKINLKENRQPAADCIQKKNNVYIMFMTELVEMFA